MEKQPSVTLPITILYHSGKPKLVVKLGDYQKWTSCLSHSQPFSSSHKQVSDSLASLLGEWKESFPLTKFEGNEYIPLSLILLHILKLSLEKKMLEFSTAVNLVENLIWEIFTDPALQEYSLQPTKHSKTSSTTVDLSGNRETRLILGVYSLSCVLICLLRAFR